MTPQTPDFSPTHKVPEEKTDRPVTTVHQRNLNTDSFILVVDDDARLRRLLKKYLSDNGFIISEAANPDEAKELIDLFSFDLIIMDVMMPGMNGMDFTRQLRTDHINTPILMLTAMGDSDNRITGLESGADDYLPKPFEPRELLLRINSILRRISLSKPNEDLYFGAYSYNIKSGILKKNNEMIPLTTTEQELLKALAERAGETVSREELATLLETDNLRSIDVQITRLRKKIEADIKKPLCIQTVRGQGYTLVTQ